MNARHLKYPLAPVLLAQGMRLRRNAPILPEAAGPRAGETGQGRELRLLVLGDSAAAGVGVAHQDTALAGRTVAALAPDFRVRWRIEAATGATTHATLRRLAALKGVRFDAALVSLGVNDVTHGVPLWLFRRQTEALNQRLGTEFGVRHIYRSGLPPMWELELFTPLMRRVLGAEARRFDAELRAMDGRDGTHRYLALAFAGGRERQAADGYHPGAAMYDDWGRLAAAAIRADFA